MNIRLSTKAPETLTPKALTDEIAKLDVISSDLTSMFIESGRGHERYSDIKQGTDPLSKAYVKVSDRLTALHFEKRRRMEYHGSLRRTSTGEDS